MMKANRSIGVSEGSFRTTDIAKSATGAVSNEKMF
jgi:hypothetical protein